MNPQNTKDNRHTTDNKKENVLINEKIKFPVLDVIDQNGKHLGTLKRNDALKIAHESELDLLVIAIQDKKVIAKF